MSADIVECANVGVLQLRDGECFYLQTLLRVGIRGSTRDQLDGNIAAQASVLGAIDLTHTASPEGGHNFVRTEFLADVEVHVSPRRNSSLHYSEKWSGRAHEDLSVVWSRCSPVSRLRDKAFSWMTWWLMHPETLRERTRGH